MPVRINPMRGGGPTPPLPAPGSARTRRQFALRPGKQRRCGESRSASSRAIPRRQRLRRPRRHAVAPAGTDARHTDLGAGTAAPGRGGLRGSAALGQGGAADGGGAVGSFQIDSPSHEQGRLDREGPVHRVQTDRPFAMALHEVAFTEWDTCVAVRGCGSSGKLRAALRFRYCSVLRDFSVGFRVARMFTLESSSPCLLGVWGREHPMRPRSAALGILSRNDDALKAAGALARRAVLVAVWTSRSCAFSAA